MSNIPFVSTVIADYAFHKYSIHPIGVTTAQIATAWITNKAFYAEIYIPESYTFSSFGWINAAALSGNIDVGIYNRSTLAKIRSTGSTAQAGATALQSVAVTQTTLSAGKYLLAMAIDNVTSRVALGALVTATATGACRVFEEASAFPLPATAVPVTCTSGFLFPVVLLLPPNW